MFNNQKNMMNKLSSKIQKITVSSIILSLGLLMSQNSLNAATVSFEVDPGTIADTNLNGFVDGNEFNPVGDDGTIFSLTPTGNLVGAPRLFLSDDKGIQFGGGGGSTLTFDFTVSQDIKLNSYTLSDTGFFLGNPPPSFNILEGASVLSSANVADAANSGNTLNFDSGPILLTQGTTYSFTTNDFGAGAQSFISEWEYTRVPEPLTILGTSTALGMGMLLKKKKRLSDSLLKK